MEDLSAVRVLADAAGFATEETLEATGLGVFLFPILVEGYGKDCLALCADQQEVLKLSMSCCLHLSSSLFISCESRDLRHFIFLRYQLG